MGLHTGRVFDGGDPLVPLGIAAAVVAGFAVAPWVVSLFAPTRRPGTELREQLESLPGSPAPARVRVVTGGRGEAVDAFAVGVFPGAEYVYVTEGLLASFDAEESAAVLAHEAGHLRLGHLRRRCAAAGLAGVTWAVVAGSVSAVGPLVATVGFAGCLLAVVLALGVRHEYAADRFAAERTGRDATLRALRSLERSTTASRAPAPLDRLSARAWLRRRIARLRVE
ncbi:hypothetical protein BRC81_13015 [Halobacteriales archaeon QS_1_68_20]|nr:MAG: hypothetical protein BRC81_13015 [Halobacteriales archaeon QS_1_68_20]